MSHSGATQSQTGPELPRLLCLFIAVYKLTTSAANIPYFASVHAFPLARRNIVATLRGSRVYRVNSSRSGGIVIILNFDKVHCPGPQNVAE